MLLGLHVHHQTAFIRLSFHPRPSALLAQDFRTPISTHPQVRPPSLERPLAEAPPRVRAGALAAAVQPHHGRQQEQQLQGLGDEGGTVGRW